MLRILHDTKVDFIRYWRTAVGLTIAFLVAGAIALAVRGVNRSIEFTGGTLMQLDFKQDPGAAAIRSALDGGGISHAEIQSFGGTGEYTVRAQESGQVAAQASGAESVARRIESVLDQRFGAQAFEVKRTEAVGPRVGDELSRGAVIAMLISFAVTMIYLAFRFEWRFGLAAVIATAHDTLATIGFLALMNIEVSLTVIAALLTVIGYSLNDTIIIFDRVRENLRKGRKEPMYDVLNRSVNETLPRSVLTHATTAAATLALLLFAGEVIRPFAWVMLFGIVTGTFSSIYVASPVLLWIERKWPRQTPGMSSKSSGETTTRTRDKESRPRTRSAEQPAGAR